MSKAASELKQRVKALATEYRSLRVEEDEMRSRLMANTSRQASIKADYGKLADALEVLGETGHAAGVADFFLFPVNQVGAIEEQSTSVGQVPR